MRVHTNPLVIPLTRKIPGKYFPAQSGFCGYFEFGFDTVSEILRYAYVCLIICSSAYVYVRMTTRVVCQWRGLGFTMRAGMRRTFSDTSTSIFHFRSSDGIFKCYNCQLLFSTLTILIIRKVVGITRKRERREDTFERFMQKAKTPMNQCDCGYQ